MNPGRLGMTRELFETVMKELEVRGAGVRESGAFLLTPTEPGVDHDPEWPQVTAVAYYDDLDPSSLTGGITFNGIGYTALNALCRLDRLRVVGDIHTHPREWVAQSTIDAAHPMVALPGHVALIAPNFARAPLDPSELGVHIFRAPGWDSYFGVDGAVGLRITDRSATREPTRPQRVMAWLRRLVPFRSAR